MKNIVIYGGRSAIAVAYAELALKRGDKLCLVGRDESVLREVSRDLCVRLNLSEEKISILGADFQDNVALVNSFRTAEKLMGEINQVLIAHGSLPDQEALQGDISQVYFHHQVNYLSAVTICETAAVYFAELGSAKGQISVISSVAGDRGRKSNYFYGASKGALSIYLQGLRGRLDTLGISVLTIKPGFVDTPMTAHLEKGPLWAKPENIAAGIVKAEERGRNVCYLPLFWLGIMTTLKLIPEMIFKKLSI